MKKHAGSRSRSRSHSPFHNREKKYPRAYQNNNREFRGYHRGFRRPYNFRGRGRGQFNRGRYHRGGGGYNNNNNFRPNWKNFKQYHHQQQPQQQQQQQQFNHSRGRSHNVQKHSGSPPQGHSQQTERSSSPLSRHSQHSSSSSHSSSPKSRPASMLANQNSKDVKEQHLASKEVQKVGGGDDEPEEHVGLLAGDTRDGAGCGKAERTWHNLTDCSSPKKSSPVSSTDANVGQSNQTIPLSSPTKITNDTRNGSPMMEAASCSSSSRKASNEGLNPMLSSFDFFSSEEYTDGDKTAISIAFKKFLEEHTKKAKSAWENGKIRESNHVDNEKGKQNGKSSVVISDTLQKLQREDIESEVSLRSCLKATQFLPAELQDDDIDEMIIRPPLKSLQKEWQNGDELSKPKSKVTHSAQKLFEKWQNAACAQFGQADLDTMVREMYLSGKHDKSETTTAALGKREIKGDFKDISPGISFKIRKTAKSPSEPPLRQTSDREMFMVRGEDQHLMPSRKQEPKCNVRMDFLGDDPMSASDILAEERQLSQDLVQSSKKHQEFRSIFQHVQTAQPQRSPSELFAQHIVAIVHHIKAQHFPSSGMTLNERFTLYQRQAAEKEMIKPRKSPEIHRRIDVSPSAFKKHPQLFEAMKSSEEGTYKDGLEKVKGDPMDLRLDIERRKKYAMHERITGDSQDYGQEKSEESLSKYSKKSKKIIRKRSRSSSSSSSSSSISHNEEGLVHGKFESKDEIFNRARLGQREPPGKVEGVRTQEEFLQKIQIQRSSWNKGSHQGNSSHSEEVNTAANAKNEAWEPKFSPRNKTYFLHDDRDHESTWIQNQGQGRGNLPPGRTRFIIRKATGNANISKWAVDKEADQDHKVEEINGQTT
ncbi:thyroid hormone receptor-associated protein 3 isoform X3 [Cyprinodon tularosa]|uniref:thyroid hormone receptor-associated protein 3 isoform X3 n=1 Tax=Cyprinodon tularosa TaxID=77115 RepID=UPI0018E27E86|nr:thyroid hormone receptor-associated protein 3 isoform X3 [Cyprinodon tularosa]